MAVGLVALGAVAGRGGGGRRRRRPPPDWDALDAAVDAAATVEALEALEARLLGMRSVAAWELARRARGRIRALRAVATRRARDPARWAPKPKRPPAPPSLFAFLGALGGIRDQGGELAALGITGRTPSPGHGALVRATGLTLDRARELAHEAGFIGAPDQEPNGAGGSAVADLLDALDREARGRRVYPFGAAVEGPAGDPDPDREAHDRAAVDLGAAESWAELVRVARAEGSAAAWAFLVERAGLLAELEEIPW